MRCPHACVAASPADVVSPGPSPSPVDSSSAALPPRPVAVNVSRTRVVSGLGDMREIVAMREIIASAGSAEQHKGVEVTFGAFVDSLREAQVYRDKNYNR